MARALSTDLRERVVGGVLEGGLSRNRAAAWFGVAVSTANIWVKRFQATGSLATGQIGGHKPAVLSGEHRDWLLGRCKGGDFTLRRLAAKLAAERGLKVDYVSVWRFVHAKGLTHKKDRPGQRAGSPGHSPPSGALAAVAALDQPGAPGVHRRNLDRDEHGAVAWLGSKGRAPARPCALWALEHHDLLGRTPA